jgi:CDGSH-type Zn-finger protein
VSDVTIMVRANGPYKVVGEVRIVHADGRELERPAGDAIVLCRCGHSRTKPFCDASHRRLGFVADGSASSVDEPRPRSA